MMFCGKFLVWYCLFDVTFATGHVLVMIKGVMCSSH